MSMLCLEHEVKRGNKVVKKELIVALRGEIYFVKFIINPEEDDVEPGVIFGRSFLCSTKAITDFEAITVTIYPDIDPFLEETEEEGKRNDDGGHLLDFNIDDIPLLGEEGLSPFVCKMGKTKEAIAIKMSRKFALLEEKRPIIDTMAYNDKYKKILDEVWKDKVELDGKILKEEEEAVNENALADTRSDINSMPFRIYVQLRRDDMKKVDRVITMINHTQVEATGILTNVLCQVGVTTLIAKFLILDIPIDRNLPIVVGRGFLRTIRAIVNTPERLFSTFDGFCHQTFRAARSDFMRNVESDSDDEEEYQIKRNKFGAPIYGPKPASYLNCNDPDERSLAIQTALMADRADPSPLVPPLPIIESTEIDLEAGPGEQIQCRICLETDGRDFIAPCKCKGTSKYVHRECLDQWRAVKEGFAFAHCTTCKAPYHLRVHVLADRKWRTMKFRFFVTRDILFIFLSVQLVISSLAYLVYLIDGYQKFWLRLAWGFDSEASFYYICGTLCMWTDCTTCFESCASATGECGCLGGAGEAGLPLIFIMAIVVLGLFTVIGIFYSVLVATMVGQRIWQRHYHILAKRMLTKEYVVEDVDGETNGSDWAAPPLPPEHIQQLKTLGLL
ncbi:putative transcription factor C2H2 family protein [Tanacetum coccineum]